MKNIADLTAEGFENLCRDNAPVRIRLSKAVLNHFVELADYHHSFESGSELGGFYPITCHFIPKFSNEYSVLLNSPGEENSQWSIVKCMTDDGSNIELYSSNFFKPSEFIKVIEAQKVFMGIPSAHRQ